MSKEQFLEFSAVLTGFSRLDLLGTGMLDLYHGALTEIVGESICGELWAEFEKLKRKCGGALDELEAAIEKHILPDPQLGLSRKQSFRCGTWANGANCLRSGARNLERIPAISIT